MTADRRREIFTAALEHALVVARDVLRASRFWSIHSDVAFSSRQRSVLGRVLHQFEGKLTVKKWASLAKTSVDSAQRDITDLVAKGILVKNPGGSKNTSYEIAPFL